MLILNKILPISSDNLYKIVERFMVEYRCELALQTGRNYAETAKGYRTDFPEIYFNNVLEGWVRSYPLTLISTRVVVDANKNDGEDAPEMHELSDFIMEIVGKGLGEQPVDGILREIGHSNTNIQSSNSKSIELNDLEECCMAWVNRDNLYANMSDFLSNYDDLTGHFYKVDKIKRTLPKVYLKGYIEKLPNGRWSALIEKGSDGIWKLKGCN
jgi:hypothetical protein